MEKKDLNGMVTDAVRYLMEHHAPKPLSQGALARLSGVSQGAICMNLKGDRRWSLDVLERLCPWLGLPLEDLIIIGRELQRSPVVFPWPSKLRDTEPSSDARLKRLIVAAVGDIPLARLVNANSVQDTHPNEYAAYREGKITDGEMYVLLRKALGGAVKDAVFLSTLDDESSALLS